LCRFLPFVSFTICVILSAALIPGKNAPIMITDEMVAKLKPGSVTVDLAASAGGNVATTVADKAIVTPNVTS